MHLQESGEMYLETILILSQKSRGVRSIDVSEYMKFSKPSVSRAIGLLKQGIRRRDLEHIDEQTWEQIIRCGMDLASEVCQSYDNYISKEFANAYVSSLK